MVTDKRNKINALAEYMKKEFGVTPENIDEKLKELKEQLYERRLTNEGSKGFQ